MKQSARITILAALLAALVTICAGAQRRITPVGAPQVPVAVRDTLSTRPDALPAPSDSAALDSATHRVPKMIYPLFHAVTIGADIWDPVMRIFGQHYGGASLWAELSLHNRYNPVVEFGLSSASDQPSGSNFRLTSPLAPYFKIGANYNFLYNSNPAYQILAGARYGLTRFSYKVTDITLDEGYWDDPSHFSIPSQTVTTGYVEVLLQLKVTLIKNFAMGWGIKWHNIIHSSRAPYGAAMTVPGFGKRGSSFTGSISLMYTLPLNRKAPPAVIE